MGRIMLFSERAPRLFCLRSFLFGVLDDFPSSRPSHGVPSLERQERIPLHHHDTSWGNHSHAARARPRDGDPPKAREDNVATSLAPAAALNFDVMRHELGC